MPRQKASPAARFAGGAAALTAVLLLAAVIYHLAVRRAASPRPPAEQAALEAGPVDKKEKILHREFVAGRLAAEVRADRYFQDPEGRRHLDGGVEVKDYGPDGFLLSLVAADSIVYSADVSRFEISGRVTVTAEGVVLEGPHFEYDKERGVFETRRGGVFTSGAMSGEASAITYDRGRQEVVLSGGFRVVVEAGERTGEKSVLTGGTLVFLRRAGRGRVTGEARFARGPVEGASETLLFTVAADESSFDSVTFSGNSRLRLTGPSGDLSEGRALEADFVAALFPAAGGGIGSLEARGGARLSLRPAAGGQARLTAPMVRLGLDGRGGLLGWSASGGFLLELDGPDGTARALEGERATGDGGMSSVAAEGGAGRAAVLDSPRLRVEAAALLVRDEGRDFDASGGVTCLFRPRPKDPSPGFFESGDPFFAFARTVERRARTEIVRFDGSARLWQGPKRLAAESLEMDEGSGEVRGKGDVTAVLPGPARTGEEPESYEASGREMRFSPGLRELFFRGKAVLRMAGARLAAEDILAVLGEEGRGLEKVTARTDVVVSEGGYEGRGREAVYEKAGDRIILSGRPVLVDKEGRASRGSKLTFDLADDKIRLENEGQERSITVVKS
jgi:lipopolysaccharide export system protein LptA